MAKVRKWKKKSWKEIIKKTKESEKNSEQRFFSGMWPWDRRGENNNLLSAANVTRLPVKARRAGLSAAIKRATQKDEGGRTQRPPH